MRLRPWTFSSSGRVLPALGLGLFIGSVLVVGAPSCGGRADDDAPPDAHANETSAPREDASVKDTGLVDRLFVEDEDVREAGIPDVAPDAGPPPELQCEPDAGENACPPSSRCLDDYWLHSYTNGRCVDGTCVWDEASDMCPYGCNPRSGQCFVIIAL